MKKFAIGFALGTVITTSLFIFTVPSSEVKAERVTEVIEVVEETTEKEMVAGIAKYDFSLLTSINKETETSTEEETTTESKIRCEWLGTEFSQSEYELLCRTVYCEAGNQDMKTQHMVCLTILNRLASGYADNVTDVIYAKNAYEVTTWKDFEGRTWTTQVEEAVNWALRENNHPSNMYYFRTDYYHSFGTPYMKSNDLYFSTERQKGDGSNVHTAVLGWIYRWNNIQPYVVINNRSINE